MPLTTNCQISPDDLRGGCSAELVWVGQKPFARLTWDAAVRLPDGSEVRRGPLPLKSVEFRWDAPPAASPRTLLGLDAGLVADSSITWEIAGRWYPRKLAFNGKQGEGRAGIYGRYESAGRVAAGVSILFGTGAR